MPDDPGSVGAGWEEARQGWLASKRLKSGSNNTARAYDTALRQMLAWAGCGPWEISPADAVEWAGYLHEVARLSPATVAVKLSGCSSYYEFVRRHYPAAWPAGMVNPFELVERPRVRAYGRARYPSTAQVQKLLGAVDAPSPTGKRDFCLMYLLVTTCRRSSEILNLRWGDIRQTRAGWTFSYRYKGGEQRTTVMPAQGRSVLVAYLLAAGRDPEGMAAEEFVFAPLYPGRARRFGAGKAEGVPAPHPISNQQANAIVWRWGQKAGLPREVCHVHGLRHAGARLRIELGKASGQPLDLLDVMNLLGHSSLAVTQVYSQEVLQDPVDPLGAQAAAFLMGAR